MSGANAEGADSIGQTHRIEGYVKYYQVATRPADARDSR